MRFYENRVYYFGVKRRFADIARLYFNTLNQESADKINCVGTI